VVVGGGAVASRKVGKLLQAGAEVVVVSPEVVPELAGMDVKVHNRTYEYGDLEGAKLAFTATASREVT
jgi:siroheme synthase (precorrin-2 oxidase/ferrochelatase)